MSLTGDRETLATARAERRAGIWIGDAAGTNVSEAVAPAPFGSFSVGATVAWAGDLLVYGALIGSDPGILRLVPGHPPAIEITEGTFGSATSDGSTIVFSDQNGVVACDRDGGHRRVLVDGIAPLVAPDDQYVVFLRPNKGAQSPWIIPVAGGTPTELIRAHVGIRSFDVSRDSRTFLFATFTGNTASFGSCDFPRCATRRTVRTPDNFEGGPTRWTPDGRSIAYLDATESNIWLQPIDGGPARQLTHFRDQIITDFRWSSDGRRLAIARQTGTSDIVLIKGLRR